MPPAPLSSTILIILHGLQRWKVALGAGNAGKLLTPPAVFQSFGEYRRESRFKHLLRAFFYIVSGPEKRYLLFSAVVYKERRPRVPVPGLTHLPWVYIIPFTAP